MKWYRMVFASICEHAGSTIIFASTSSEQFSHASRDTLEITNGDQRALRKFSARWNLSFIKAFCTR